MFTLKKIALLGAAGLAAFSMSCSDSDGSGPGGEFSSPLTVTLDSEGYVELGGAIKASEGDEISSVTATAGGVAVALLPPPALPAATVNLAGINLVGICEATNTNVSKSFDIKITVKFKDGDDISGTGKVTVDCSTEIIGGDLNKASMTLSYDGSSFGDVDAGKIYKVADLATHSTAMKIDIIAYATSSAEDKIYAPSAIEVKAGSSDDLYWDLFVEYCADDDFEVSPTCSYNPYSIGFFALPDEAVDLLSAATTVAELAVFTPLLEVVTAGEWLTEVPATKDTGFLVNTSEDELIAVLITSTGAKLVNLSAISMPE